MADKIRFNCICEKSLSASLESAGNSLDCPRCGETMRVPTPAWASVAEETFSDDGASQLMAGGKFTSAGSTPRSPVQTPNVKPSRSKGNSLWGGDDDFLSQQNLASACSMCGARMSDHAVVCLACGHNKQTKKSNPALASEILAPSTELSASGHVRPPARDQESGGGGTKLLIGGVAILMVLGVGAFFSKPIGLAAVLIGFVSLILGMGSGFLGGIVELTQNAGARRNFLHTVMLTTLVGPLGFIALRHTRNRPYSRLSNLGRLLVMIGLPLMMLGVFGIAKQVPHRRAARPAIKAAQPLPAKQLAKERARRAPLPREVKLPAEREASTR
jgi:hypothetical protein